MIDVAREGVLLVLKKITIPGERKADNSMERGDVYI